MRRRPGIVLATILFLSVASWIYVNRPRPAKPVTILVKGTRAPNQPKRLIVYAHSMGYGFRRTRRVFDHLLREPELAGSDLLLFEPRAFRLTPGPSAGFATRLRAEIDAQWVREGGYDDVILAGSSLGSLLIRQAYLTSAGRDPKKPRTIPWSDRVSRIVLMGGIGRGINIENEGNWKWIVRIGRYIPMVRESVAYDQLRGAEFVTSIRIAWIRHFEELNRTAASDTSARKVPIVVQLLGTEDSFVRHEDNIDFDQFPNAFHIDVPGAQHEVFWFGSATDSALRYSLYREAFFGRSLPHASPRPVLRDSIDRVIFLLHGIRSSRDSWVKELAATLRARLPRAEVVESSYGQISVLGFALPTVRRRERRWLQDQYSEYLARHPSATFDVVAHSNGTYLLGESLARLPVMTFNHVAVLGSVLPKDYSWRERHNLRQVGTVRSDRAAGDVVVAVVSNALHGLGMMDVGTSGWSGFDEAGDFIVEPPLLPGGHDATLTRQNLAGVAEFIANGRGAPLDPPLTARPSQVLRLMSAAAPWVMFLVCLLVPIAAFYWVLRAAPSRRIPRVAAIFAGVVMLAIILDVL